MGRAVDSSEGSPEALQTEPQDGAPQFHSNDFEWETLRAEIEDSPAEECETVEVDGTTRIVDTAFAPIAWEAFHKSHSKALFFKERRYLPKEFPELLSASSPVRILEVGCGSGSSVVPILRGSQSDTVYGCDCSNAALERATELVTKQAGLTESQIRSFHPFICDVSSEALPSWLCCLSCRTHFKQRENRHPEQFNDSMAPNASLGQVLQSPPTGNCCVGGVSIITLIFTLSAIPLENMHLVLAEIGAVLRPGGALLFRDYGLYDMTMLRFPSSQRVSNRLYRRKDGTLAYFFSLEVVRDLFRTVGLVEEELHYCCVRLMNRRKQLPMRRVWIHGKFRKPLI